MLQEDYIKEVLTCATDVTSMSEAQNKIISASKLSSCKLKVKHPSLHNVYSCWVCKFAGALYERGTLVLQSLSSA